MKNEKLNRLKKFTFVKVDEMLEFVIHDFVHVEIVQLI